MRNEYSEVFNHLLAQNGVTAYKVAKDLSISQGTMNEYKNGKKTPTVRNLIKIADYFGCSVDYLLGRTNKKEINK